ncbi:MAG: tetratricopeptide repeat protein [Rhizobiaceae bacterium]|nr:tetratricopeptide repeat protein [Rhizobiaceae bacterium]
MALEKSKTILFSLVFTLPLLLMPVNANSAGEAEPAKPRCKTGKIWNFSEKKCMSADEIKTKKSSAKKKAPIKCRGQKVWDAKKKRCIKDEQSSSLDQDTLYTYAKTLARSGNYNEAIEILYSAPDQSDPRILNYLGFSNRKLGNMDKALEYYHAAVATNPDFTLVREYLGEAYIQLGQLEKAREQLTQIERICGTANCREYSMLSKVMVDSQLQ